MSAPLLLGYAVFGGFPPPTLESLRVFEDGSARAVVTNAWPDGERLDEAGVYEANVDAERVRALRDALREHAGEHGPVHGDSGGTSIALGEDEPRIVWGAHSTPPEPVLDAVKELRALLADVREHPVAAVRLERAGGELALSNPGEQPVGVTLARVRVGEGEPSLSTYRAATNAGAFPDGELGAGERVAIPDERSGVAFVTLTLALPGSAPLDGLLICR